MYKRSVKSTGMPVASKHRRTSLQALKEIAPEVTAVVTSYSTVLKAPMAMRWAHARGAAAPASTTGLKEIPWAARVIGALPGLVSSDGLIFLREGLFLSASIPHQVSSVRSCPRDPIRLMGTSRKIRNFVKISMAEDRTVFERPLASTVLKLPSASTREASGDSAALKPAT
ncbi:hypothetical protein IQ06DRAFT_299530 [Phaeosphaeriaceae sp. SRC1lsM3a]|nr:hypothetical protein IQ06DRAFT_299530 [Stagonospora sp. SRC1lsM3a]